MSRAVHSLSLFPNSGHHTGFLALVWDDALSVPEPDSVQWSGPEGEAAQKLVQRAKADDWRSPVGAPWIRARIGKKDVRDNETVRPVYGVWISVDTTVGGPNRGYTVTPAADNDEFEVERVDNPPYVTDDAATLTQMSKVVLNDALKLEDGVPDIVVEIEWLEPAGDDVLVDLVVDFGNTRTVVFAVERIADSQGAMSVCRPIMFPGAEWDEADADYTRMDLSRAIPDSWFMLVEGAFPDNPLVVRLREQTEEAGGFFLRGGPARKQTSEVFKAPHIFRELSPALIGSAARERLSFVNIDHGGLSFLSSPKRYIWDVEATGTDGNTVWTMNQQPWRSARGRNRRLTPLDGELLRFMPRAGDVWRPNADADEVSVSLPSDTDTANHARSEALTWVALAILEAAETQFRSERWREGNRPFLPRRLGDILLTYPAGWTESEMSAYAARWNAARDIFIASREPDAVQRLKNGSAPHVKLDLDESVAPQLVLVYSEIHHMRDYGRNWIELYGRGEGANATIRVMTIDIGGGTTDISVQEYRDRLDGVGVDLYATPLFKDSNSIAGDRLVKDLIECVLLPALGEKFADDPVARETFEDMFFAKSMLEAEKAQWSVITRTVLIPIVHAWLSDLITAPDRRREPLANPVSPKAAGASAEQVAKLNRLAVTFGLDEPVIDYDAPISVDVEAARRTIQAWFSDPADTVARYCAIYDCDIVMLTGKPSELPEVRALLEYRLPLAPNRILSMRGYFAGNWLPLTRDGRIPDAKLVTALGGVIYQGMITGLIPGWRLSGTLSEHFRVHNYWGRMAGDAKPFTQGDILLNPDDYEVSVDITSDTYIGRAAFLFHVRPDQVYHLRLKGAQGVGVRRRLQVILRRVIGDEVEADEVVSGEALELMGATDLETGKRLSLDDVELRLCTLPRGEAFWQDTGRFEVRWET